MRDRDAEPHPAPQLALVSALVRAVTAADLEQRTDLYVAAKKAGGFAKAALDETRMRGAWNASAALTGLPLS